ncbi:hypothetical protein Fmac_005998 [Flemingia macrophylla]|uniref:RNase H type-1 domain-containing protein n=1 Tax=Flemingia macrophylla TaxID=520843 RepID=A0ABD1N9D2_9FABA
MATIKKGLDPLLLEQVKLTCDGAIANSSIAACGGIVRDYIENMLLAFAAKLPQCSTIEANLWAILFGLQIMQDQHVEGEILVETDSMEAWQTLLKISSIAQVNNSLVNTTTKWISQLPVVNIFHIPRESNMRADCMAKVDLNLAVKHPKRVTLTL